MRYCIDIDGTICSQEVDYNKAKPYRWRIKKVNNGYDVVFLAKKTTLDKNNIELEKEVKEVFQDSGLAQ